MSDGTWKTRGDLLTDVSTATRLEEGPEAVRKMLWLVHRHGNIPVRDVARLAHLPVPVVAAARRELERRGILVRRKGIALSDAGESFVREALGIRSRRAFPSPSGGAEFQVPPDLDPLRATLTEIGRNRPGVDVTLDQSHATPETALRRALLMYENDALEGRDILILGDDDLLSVALGLLRKTLTVGEGAASGRITALDVDRRLVDYISEVSEREGIGLESIPYDLRQPLPEALEARFDVFATDPPYTAEGLELFVSRAVRALRPEKGKQGFISFAHKSPDQMVCVQRKLAEMGLFAKRVMPAFNEYEGAQILAGSSQMIQVVSTSSTHATLTGSYEGPMYTRDLKESPKTRRSGR
jgi:predicted methyltransferase